MDMQSLKLVFHNGVLFVHVHLYILFCAKIQQEIKKKIHRNQKDVGMAMVNKVHIQVWIPLLLALYIVTHNHSYISSCKPDLLLLQLLIDVGMVMRDNVHVGC